MPNSASTQVAPDDILPWRMVFFAWLVAAASTLGSLFFSEVMALPVCVLCWYQRICMFPLALLLPLGLFPFDRRIIRYALPFAALGGMIAIFHQLLVVGIIPEAIRPCSQGVPCSETVISWFGFLTIPLLAILAFSSLVALLLAAHFRSAR